MIKKNPALTKRQKDQLIELTEDEWPVCFPHHSRDYLRREKRKLKAALPAPSALTHEEIVRERQQQKNRTNRILSEALAQRDQYKKTLGIVDAMRKDTNSLVIKKGKASSKANRTTAVFMTSDQHIEEPVDPSKVNGLNEYSLEIAKLRFQTMFANQLKLLARTASGIKLDKVILWLGGDCWSGDIHDDTAEGASLRPLEAALQALAIYRGGIRYLRANLPEDVHLHVVGSYGNHGRITKKKRVLLARETNLEWYTYQVLAEEFKTTPGVTVTAPMSYHTYVDVYGYRMRFHHGDEVRFGGGVGGLTIPLNKKIAKWNTAWTADLDVLGHFHTFFDGGNFIVNGSLIGYNPLSVAWGFAYEKPVQGFFLIDENRGKTITAPVFVEAE